MRDGNAEQYSLFLWHGLALVVGPGVDSCPHAHYAAQLTLALDRPFRARLGPELPWQETRSAIFAPNQPHQLDCSGGMLAHLFVELPQRQQVVTTIINAQYHALPAFDKIRTGLVAARAGALDTETAEHIARQWVCCALPDAQSPHGFDPRIGRALEWIAAHPGVQPSGALLASKVHLSESRFTHLFRQQTGLSLSRYLLWMRLFDSVAAVAQGDNMTNAAHRAGFSDLAHMSRTFRNTFGVVPSELHKMTIAFKRKGD